jgi:hypothetical protein
MLVCNTTVIAGCSLQSDVNNLKTQRKNLCGSFYIIFSSSPPELQGLTTTLSADFCFACLGFSLYCTCIFAPSNFRHLA